MPVLLNAPKLSIGRFGAGTGVAAALVAAGSLGDRIGAVVSRGGRPDRSGDILPQVRALTLLIVGGAGSRAIELNRAASELHGGEKRIEIISGAIHPLPEPGVFEAAIELAAGWFERHLVDDPASANRTEGNDDVPG